MRPPYEPMEAWFTSKRPFLIGWVPKNCSQLLMQPAVRGWRTGPIRCGAKHGETDGAPFVLCQFVMRKTDAASLLRHQFEQTTPGDHLGPLSSLKINLRRCDFQFCAKLHIL